MPLDPQAKVLIDLIEGTGDFALTPDSDPQERLVPEHPIPVRAAFGRA